MIQHPSSADAGAWRPQRFGGKRSLRLVQPLFEPLWIGERILLHLPEASLVPARDDRPLPGPFAEEGEAIAALAAQVLRAETAVLDGYLTRQASQGSEGTVVDVTPISPTAPIRRLFLGETESRREAQRRAHVERVDASLGEIGAPLAFVAVDILALDGTPLLDLPLLERKRLLESVLPESETLRVGPYVRAPAERWFATWRGLGFAEVALKDANGRYLPGEANPGWAAIPIPRR